MRSYHSRFASSVFVVCGYRIVYIHNSGGTSIPSMTHSRIYRNKQTNSTTIVKVRFHVSRSMNPAASTHVRPCG